ncbi:MAG TPA: biotin/lipoyl-containing protein [Verrucomicrobiae bacterium]|nr:biotin/lipoyl-containing protein [Verrucomicrobiae bacterium]
MKLTIQLGEKSLAVETARIGERWKFAIDGKPVEADIVEARRGIYSILLAGKSIEVRLAEIGSRLRVQAEGYEWEAEIRDPRKLGRGREGALEAEGRQQVTAPMPGKVVRVLVEAGEKVSAGQGLMVVEAMKMQNEVRSPKSGTVERMLAKEGQAVSAGDALAVIS